MDPVEVLEVLTKIHENGKEYVTEIRGSQELFDRMDARGGDTWPGIKRTVKEPDMITLKLPDFAEEAKDGSH